MFLLLIAKEMLTQNEYTSCFMLKRAAVAAAAAVAAV